MRIELPLDSTFWVQENDYILYNSVNNRTEYLLIVNLKEHSFALAQTQLNIHVSLVLIFQMMETQFQLEVLLVILLLIHVILIIQINPMQILIMD